MFPRNLASSVLYDLFGGYLILSPGFLIITRLSAGVLLWGVLHVPQFYMMKGGSEILGGNTLLPIKDSSP